MLFLLSLSPHWLPEVFFEVSSIVFMKSEAKIYKGIEYIQINDLPVIQKESLLKTLNKDLFIKIMIDGKIIADCLQYKDYSFWYHSVWKAKPVSEEQRIPEGNMGFPKLAPY